jgi:hypothetical protein
LIIFGFHERSSFANK